MDGYKADKKMSEAKEKIDIHKIYFTTHHLACLTIHFFPLRMNFIRVSYLSESDSTL